MNAIYKTFALGIIAIIVLGKSLNAQCSSCTKTISGTLSSLDTIKPGEKICIDASAIINGNVVMLGGELCNSGSINGFLIIFDGIINNYGTIFNQGNMNLIYEGTSISAGTFFFKGIWNNYKKIESENFLTSFYATDINNYDTIISTNIAGLKGNFVNKGYLSTTNIAFTGFDLNIQNYANIDAQNFNTTDTMITKQKQPGVMIMYNHPKASINGKNIAFLSNVTNEGTIYSGYNLSTGAVFLNKHLLICDTNFANTGTFINDDSLKLGVNSANNGTFTNNKSIIASGKLGNTRKFTNNSSILVGGYFAHSGTLGEFYNYGDLTVNDNAAISDHLYNYNYIHFTDTLDIFKLQSDTVFNYEDASFIVDKYAKNAAVIKNEGEIIFEKDFKNSFGAYLLNYKEIIFRGNVSNDGKSISNRGYMKCEQNLDNNGGFFTECMIEVWGDWTNKMAGIITGPTDSSYGGFIVNGYTSNLGKLADNSSNIDVCDLGSPANGLDNKNITGKIGSNVTFCTNTSNVCLPSVTTGIEKEEVQSVNIYPNPGNGLFTIQSSLNIEQITVFDLMAKVVYQHQNNAQQIDLTHLNAGTYFIQITEKQQTNSYKIVITH